MVLYTSTRPGVSSCPPGCKILPENSKVTIEQNFASCNNVTSGNYQPTTWNSPEVALTWPDMFPPIWPH